MRFWVAFTLIWLSTRPLGGQPRNQTSIRFYVVVPQPETLGRTVAGIQLTIIDSSETSQVVTTGPDAVAIVRLPIGPHRVLAEYTWRDRRYRWTLPVEVTFGLRTVTLDSSNAASVERIFKPEVLSRVIVTGPPEPPPRPAQRETRLDDPVFWPTPGERVDRFVTAQAAINLFWLGVLGRGRLPLLQESFTSPCTEEVCVTIPAAFRTAIAALLIARAVPSGLSLMEGTP